MFDSRTVVGSLARATAAAEKDRRWIGLDNVFCELPQVLHATESQQTNTISNNTQRERERSAIELWQQSNSL